MSQTRDKKLVYILNYISADDTQHFVHVLNLLHKMEELGWSIVLLSEKGGVGMQNVSGHEVRYLSHSSRLIRLFRLVTTLISLRRQGYRLVFVRISRPAALVSAVVGRIIGFTSLFWLSGMVLDFDKYKSPVQRFSDSLSLNLIMRSISRFVTGPETMVDYYKKEFSLADKKIVMLYNDIDIDKFAPVQRQHKDCGPIDILLLHRLSPVRETNKYIPDIIKHLNALAASGQKIVLNIVGDGPERDELEHEAEAAVLGLDIRFHGSIPNRLVTDFYGKADIFIMPSVV